MTPTDRQGGSAPAAVRPFTGAEFLESLRDRRDGWIAPDLITPTDVNLFLKRPE